MKEQNQLNTGQPRERWGSKFGFILATAGSAVGLGNIWRFPYMTGAYGGASFVLLYLGIIVLIGASMLIVDFVIGRHGRANAVESYRKISSKFVWMGYLGIFCAILVLSYYAVIGGWITYYGLSSFTSLRGLDSGQVGEFFGAFSGHPWKPLIFQLSFMVFTVVIVMGGIKKGIEKWNKILMPALLIMLVILVIKSLTLEGGMEGVKYFLKPDSSKITWATVVAATGQVFFSLNIGTTGMVVYGSYLDDDINIPKSSLPIIATDTAVALLAGLIVFPTAFAFGVEPGSGPGLVFVTIPSIYSSMPFGGVFSFLFFALLLFASVTSSISILEIVVAFLREKTNLSRKNASIWTGVLCMILGIPVSLGFGIWQNVTFFGKGIFDLFDFFATNVSYLMIALFSAILVGWIWKKEEVIDAVSSHGLYSRKVSETWYYVVKFVCVVGLSIVALSLVGILK